MCFGRLRYVRVKPPCDSEELKPTLECYHTEAYCRRPPAACPTRSHYTDNGRTSRSDPKVLNVKQGLVTTIFIDSGMSRPGDRTQSLPHRGGRSTKAKSEAVPREALGRRKLFRKRRKDKDPKFSRLLRHAMGAAGIFYRQESVQ